MSVLDVLLLVVIICLLGVDGGLALVRVDAASPAMLAEQNAIPEMFAP